MSRPSLFPALAVELENRITSGIYAPGERMPSERDLAVECHVAQTTVHKALAALAERQLVTPHHGHGWIVCRDRQQETRRDGDVLVVMGVDHRQLNPNHLTELLYMLIEQHAGQHGRRLLHWLPNRYTDGIDFVRELSQSSATEVILYQTNTGQLPTGQDFWVLLKEIPKRIVRMGVGLPSDSVMVDMITVDWLSGTRAAVDFLVRRGCRRLLFAGYEGVDWSDERRGGFLRELRRHRLWEITSPPPCLHVDAPGGFPPWLLEHHWERVAQALVAYLREHDVDGVLCANDRVIEYANKLMPLADLPLMVGYDNSVWVAERRISSVCINVRRLVDETFNVLALPPSPLPRVVTVPTMLIER